MSFVLRRSLPTMGGLVALLVGVGLVLVLTMGLPVWFPALFALAVVLLQYALNPRFIRWLVPATVIPHDGVCYATDDVVGELVARRCRDAGIPFVRLGIVDDGTPNAFTFGHTRRDACVWVTRGLLERLGDDELDAVIAHEIGHVKNNDFIVMTVAAAVPLFLYFLYLTTRSSRREGATVAVTAYVAYLISQLVVLGLSRARESAADHWSCEITGNGDALASALIKVGYGIGQVRAERAEQVRALTQQGKEGKKEANALRARWARLDSVHALGIFDPGRAAGVEIALGGAREANAAIGAMRWDLANPWAGTLEKLSSHPLVARRIRALEHSGLAGAPTVFSTDPLVATITRAERDALRVRWVTELAIALAPWVVLGAGVGAGLTASPQAAGLVLTFAGALFVVKQVARYGTRFTDVDRITDLFQRVDAGPVVGVPVVIRGTVVGRGSPGYVLSPDLVVSDDTGFVPLVYRQPLSFLEPLFGLARVRRFLGQEVVARGWYRRSPSPVIELRTVVRADGGTASCWEWMARYAAAVAVLAAGLFVLASGVG